MRRNLLLCCEEKNRERFQTKIRRAFGSSVTVVDELNQSDLIYVVGTITPAIQQQLSEYKESGIKTVYVNENLVNENVCGNVFGYKSRDQEKER